MKILNKLLLSVIIFFTLCSTVQGQAILEQKVLYQSSPIDKARYVWNGYNEYCELYPLSTSGYCQRGELRGRYADTKEKARFTPTYAQSFSEPKYIDISQYGAGYGIFGVAYPCGQDTTNTNPNYYNKFFCNAGYQMLVFHNFVDKNVPLVEIDSGGEITAPLIKFALATNGGATAPVLSLVVGKGNPTNALEIINEEPNKAGISIKSPNGTTELKNDSLFINGVDKLAELSASIDAQKSAIETVSSQSKASKVLVFKDVSSSSTIGSDVDFVVSNCSCVITLPTNNFVGKIITIKNIKIFSSIERPLVVLGRIDKSDRIEFKSYMRAISFIWDGDEWYSF
jgi:hypothetical protein